MAIDPMEEMQASVQDAQVHDGEHKTLTPEEEFDSAFEEDLDVDAPHGELSEPRGEASEPTPGEVDMAPPSANPEPHSVPEDEQGDQRYKSMMGRLKASQQEVSDLKTQLSDMRARFEALSSSARPHVQEEPIVIDGLEDLPEEVRPLVQENSREGMAVRKMLEEYGPEHASVMAQSVLARREAANATVQMRQQYEMDNDKRHRMALADAHPEFAAAILGDAAKWQELENGINAWIQVLPYAEASELVRIKQSGTTQEVSNMLAKYKQYRTGRTSARPVQHPTSAASRIARSNVAVPSAGRAVPPKEKANDYDSAWDEAPD